MKKPARFYILLVVLVLASLALSACAGALDAQGLNFNDLTGSQTVSTESVHSTEPPEIHTTGTPEVNDQGTEVPETEAVDTEAPETEQPHASKTPEAHGSPESDNSHEVLGVVTAIDPNSITINNVTYELTGTSVILGTVQQGDKVRLTFRDVNGTLVVNEVKATDANGSSDGQGDNSNSHEGGVHENGTPEPDSGDSGGG